jgi:hypothetical protein
MTRLERSWAVTLLSAFAPTGAPGLSPREHEVDYLAAYSRLVHGAAPLASLGLRFAVCLTALAPLWHWRRPRTVVGLTSVERTRLVDELLRHRTFVVRELLLLVKYAAALALLGTASVRARSGYDAPSIATTALYGIGERPQHAFVRNEATARERDAHREAS